MELIPLKDDEYFERLKVSGSVVAKCLKSFQDIVSEHIPNLNLLDIENMCYNIIKENKCVPTFYNYKGFPGKVCLSVNKALVHGIPHDYVLKEGDLVTLDLGAHTECGVIADAAVTAIYGKPKKMEHKKMLDACYKSLFDGINNAQVGNRLGKIGSAIHYSTKSSGFKLITDYGGHGINRFTPHAQPFVANKADKDEGIRIRPGLHIAIEPMLAIGSNKTRKMSDGWTVLTKDVGCHYEHTIFVREDGPVVMTDWEHL